MGYFTYQLASLTDLWLPSTVTFPYFVSLQEMFFVNRLILRQIWQQCTIEVLCVSRQCKNYCVCPSHFEFSLVHACKLHPGRLTLEPTNYPFRKANDLNQTSMIMFQPFIFRGPWAMGNLKIFVGPESIRWWNVLNKKTNPSVSMYIYLKPQWPLCVKVNPSKQDLFQAKKGSFGF